MNVLIRIRASGIAGETNLVSAGMARVAMVKAADNGPLGHDLAAEGQQVAQNDSRHARRPDAEFAPVLGRGVWLRIPHVDMAWPATHPEDDYRLDAGYGAGPGLRAQYLGQAQSRRSEDAGLQKAAPIDLQTAMEVGTAAQRIAHGLFPERNVSDVAEGH